MASDQPAGPAWESRRWRRSWRAVAAAPLIAFAVVACSGGEAATPVRTDPHIPTVPPPDVVVVPDVITVAYVQAVIDTLDAAYGDALRLAQSEGAVTDEVMARLEALYPRDQVDLEAETFRLAIGNGFVSYQSPIGNRRSTVEEILSIDPRCVRVRVERDESAHFQLDDPLFTVWVYMSPRRDQPSSYNPTPWTFVYDGPYSTSEGPTPSCLVYTG